MRHARAYGLVGLAALAVVAAAVAQTTVVPLGEEAPVDVAPLPTVVEKATWGDVQAGQALAGTCAACHGLDGNPPVDQYPRLAGLPELYVAQQLMLFKKGERNTEMAAIMQPFAEMLTAQQMRDLGAYYQTQVAGAGIADDTVIADGPNVGLKFYELGERIYRSGNVASEVPSCMACHGPAGQGNPGPPWPALAGQNAEYVARRLQGYRAEEPNDPDYPNYQVMASVAKNLTDEEILAVSTYVQGLHPRDLAVGAPVPETPAVLPGAAPAANPAAPLPQPTQPVTPMGPPATAAPAPAATPTQG